MIFEQLKKDSFCNSEKQIIEFLYKHADSFDHITLDQMARESFSSNSSVLRFCKKLGFHGFKDFKLQLIRELSLTEQNLDFNLPFSPDDSVKDIGIHLSQIIINGIKKTQHSLDLAQLEMAAYSIKKSHRVFLFGKGDSRICLENFKNKMIKLNQYFIIADEYQESSYTIGNINSNDLVIFCSYSAMQQDYISYLSVLKQHDVPIITLTSNISSDIAKASDIVLQLPDDETFDEKVASFTSQTNMNFIFDYIYSIIFQKNYMENYHLKHAKDVYTNSIISRRS